MNDIEAAEIRATILHHVGTTRDLLDRNEALHGERPPTTTLEHVARISSEVGHLAHASRVGEDPHRYALALAADALGLLEWLAEQERPR